MPPSTIAERHAALEVLRELHEQVERAAEAPRLRRARQARKMVETMGMSRREIGDALGVSHNAVRYWLKEGTDGSRE